MNNKKSYIPIKVLISYLVLAALFVGVSWFLYSENRGFSETESKAAKENNKILKVSNLLSNIYKTESLARITIQSDSEKDFKNYISKTDSLKVEIDSLKLLVTTQYQITLLDSVKLLLSKKTNNIKELKSIKNKSNDEAALKKAINDLTKMESSLRKLQLEDFIRHPEELGNYQRNVLKKYVAYLNENIPDDSTNTLSKKESDSIITVSKTLLNAVKNATLKKKYTLNFEENKLLQNELLISDQLRKVLSIIETEIIRNTTRNYLEKERSLKRNNQIVTIAAILGLFSTLFFLILILNDFSKTQSYKKQLEEANSTTKKLLRNREQLISTVSHDLKTPLNTIVGYTELLGNSELTKKQLYFAKNIKGSSEYITKLIQDLLDFTQIEAGKITIEKLPFSLYDVINEVAKSIQSVYEQKPIHLSIDIEEVFQNKIIGDPFRLRQIVTNIIGNAFKFTSEGFIRIEVKANIENHFITIKIEDSGIGIQEDKQQLIFEEFTQANKNIEKIYGGTGLGLTISKKMVEILGGKLSLKSVYGKGSIFEIQLPLLFDSSPSSASKNPVIDHSSNKLTAVVVDDDINLLNLTTEILHQNNFKVLSFSNALAALEALENNPFDFIITDIQMPEIDGFLFLKKLKESTIINFDKKPVIAMTGRTDLEREIYIKAGFADVIRKPYSPKILLEIIDSILNNNESHTSTNHAIEQGEDSTKKYSLTSLKLFLSNEEGALKELLLPFITSTKENLVVLEDGISEKDILKVRETAHRMGPMFKQIEAHEIVQILSDLELKESSFEELGVKFKILKTAIVSLFLLLEKELN
ncbi:ATP-binding response regulator [Flavobacterium aestivum]|uniref:ATP-binding response regulator n=1 Tax=Flavobacterium aestivum TaxID=3003257 RepID=UPI002482E851|nr:hybrid sensor histidine kinase/response regulator [Flavobacterium aestivum]